MAACWLKTGTALDLWSVAMPRQAVPVYLFGVGLRASGEPVCDGLRDAGLGVCRMTGLGLSTGLGVLVGRNPALLYLPAKRVGWVGMFGVGTVTPR